MPPALASSHPNLDSAFAALGDPLRRALVARLAHGLIARVDSYVVPLPEAATAK